MALLGGRDVAQIGHESLRRLSLRLEPMKKRRAKPDSRAAVPLVACRRKPWYLEAA